MFLSIVRQIYKEYRKWTKKTMENDSTLPTDLRSRSVCPTKNNPSHHNSRPESAYL